MLRRCLEKDTGRRYRDIADVQIQIEEVPDTGEMKPPLKRPWFVWSWASIATLLVIVSGISVFLHFQDREPVEAMQFLVQVPPRSYEISNAISPDGRLIAFIGSSPKGGNTIYVREIGSVTLRQLKMTEGATYLFWSPDSASVAFGAGGRLKRVEVSGGTPQDICDAGGFRGGTWNSNGVIVFADWPVLHRVSAEGGEPVAISVLDESRSENAHGYPCFLPDGRHYVFNVRSSITSNSGIYLGSLDSKEKTKLLTGLSTAVYADPGYLFFLWLIDWERNVPTRLTFDPAGASDIAWSPDGLQVGYSSVRKGNADIFTKNASGVGEEVLIQGTMEDEWIEDWSRDGRYIAYGSGISVDLCVLPLFGDRKPLPIVLSPASQDEPHFSFDGKWLAYGSNESGTWEIFVTNFPAADQRHQISTNGGGQPRWREDGKELHYLALDGKMMVVDIRTNTKIESGIPRALFDTNLSVDPFRDQYAVTPDGQRFLLLKPLADKASAPITVILNWTSQLNK